MSEDRNTRLYEFFRAHPALLASAFYVAASVVGMFWSWAYLQHFGINVFNYAQVSDFLIASLKEPFTWALVALAVLLVSLDNAYSRRVERRSKSRWFRWYGSPRYRFINDFGSIAVIGVFIFTYASLEADNTRSGEGKIVEVSVDGQVRSATLLGTTGQFVFLYDTLTERVDIHPIENIESISFQAD
jgi:hypothetical protein